MCIRDSDQGGDNNYPDQNEFWNEDNNNVGDVNGDGVINNLDKNLDAAQNGGKITYRSWIHHTQLGTTNWTMVEDVAGMVPREDNKIELNPIEIPGWKMCIRDSAGSARARRRG